MKYNNKVSAATIARTAAKIVEQSFRHIIFIVGQSNTDP